MCPLGRRAWASTLEPSVFPPCFGKLYSRVCSSQLKFGSSWNCSQSLCLNRIPNPLPLWLLLYFTICIMSPYRPSLVFRFLFWNNLKCRERWWMLYREYSFSPGITWELPTRCPIPVKILVCNSSEQHSFLHSCIDITLSYVARIQPSHSRHVATNLTVGPVQVSLTVPRMDPVVLSLSRHFRSLWTMSYFPQLSWPWQL